MKTGGDSLDRESSQACVQSCDELTSRGVTFPVPPMKMPFGWWALFEDNDGTRYALTQANA